MDKRTVMQIVNDVINFIIKDLEEQDPNKTYTVAEFIEGLKELLLEVNNDDTQRGT